jgi:ribose transport system substrate-binding protein
MKLPFAGRLLAVSVLAAVYAAAPFSSAWAETTEKPKVALVMKSLANEFFLTMEEGAKDYQKAHSADFDLISNGIKDESDTANQIRIVEQMIVSKVNALVIAPADSKALVPVIKKAMDAGITVVNIDNQLDPAVLKSKNLSVPFVGPDNRKGARLVGEYLAKDLKAGDEVGIIEGVPTTTNAQQRTAGFKDAMSGAQMKVVSVQSGNWEIDKGNAVASAMLNEYPNLKALLAGNDSMALGAVSAVRAAGKVGKVQVVGYDNINAIKPMLKDGRVLATADQFAAKQAVFGIQAALKMLKHERVDGAANGVIETPVELVTKAAATQP